MKITKICHQAFWFMEETVIGFAKSAAKVTVNVAKSAYHAGSEFWEQHKDGEVVQFGKKVAGHVYDASKIAAKATFEFCKEVYHQIKGSPEGTPAPAVEHVE